MILPFVAEAVVWYGPATVSFPVQFAGDPFDPVRNDVRVRFIGDKNQREERLAYFDSRLGVWRAILYSNSAGSYRAVLVRNGSEVEVEATEGIIELKRSDVGVLPAKQTRENRWSLDTGDDWVGFGSIVSASSTVRDVNALADAGANWLWIRPPFAPEPSADWEELMEAVEKRGFYYTIQMRDDATPAWRRYCLARYGTSPRLVQWDTKTKVEDPWGRGASSAAPWDTLFENQRGPFYTTPTDFALVKALKTTLEVSDWARWRSARAWKIPGADGVAESDRMILDVSPGARIVGAPLADGSYDMTTIDRSTGHSASGTAQVSHGAFDFKGANHAFLVLRRRV